MNISAILISNKYDKERMKHAIISLNINKINFKIVGFSENWNFINKIYCIRSYLEKIKENKIVIFSDSYDTFYLKNLEEIKINFLNMNVKILWSAEKPYSHQLSKDKKFYESISCNSNYKYINTGACIGFSKELLEFYNNLLEKVEKEEKFMNEVRTEKKHNYGIDQTIISHYISQNYSKHNVKIDYNCEIFYTASDDWDDIDNYISADLMVKETNSFPCFVHVPFKGRYKHILENIFFKKYKFLGNKNVYNNIFKFI
jgi:hypothetical protein